MMNFRGEGKKYSRREVGRGASKVVLTGDRFLTCFPSHLLSVKARRQSRIWGRRKRGVSLEKMTGQRGIKGYAILTSNGESYVFAL